MFLYHFHGDPKISETIHETRIKTWKTIIIYEKHKKRSNTEAITRKKHKIHIKHKKLQKSI